MMFPDHSWRLLVLFLSCLAAVNCIKASTTILYWLFALFSVKITLNITDITDVGDDVSCCEKREAGRRGRNPSACCHWKSERRSSTLCSCTTCSPCTRAACTHCTTRCCTTDYHTYEWRGAFIPHHRAQCRRRPLSGRVHSGSCTAASVESEARSVILDYVKLLLLRNIYLLSFWLFAKYVFRVFVCLRILSFFVSCFVSYCLMREWQ